MKLFNEPGKQKLGRYESPVSRHSSQSYILTYHRLIKREHLISLDSHQGWGWGRWGGALISASAVPHHGVLLGSRTDREQTANISFYYSPPAGELFKSLKNRKLNPTIRTAFSRLVQMAPESGFKNEN